MEDNVNADICRVCRCEGTADKPLYHPCICTGSIKYIHQECLVQWLRYSEKEFCELCNHRFSFIPIYSPDMPKRLPIKDILSVLLRCLITAGRYWFQSILVVTAWLGIIPLASYRIYMLLFNNSWNNVVNLNVEFFKRETLFADGFYGCCVVMCAICTFISVLWLREQIIRVGAPDWLGRPFDANRFLRLILAREQIALPNVNNNVAVGAEAVEDANEEDDEEDEDDDEDDNENDEEDVDNNDANNGQNNNNENAPLVNDDRQQANPGGLEFNLVIEWDRGAEDVTWERVFGLDGTFAFLENVFWLITLNTLFILGFAFVPYNIGNIVFRQMNIETIVSPQFDRFLNIFVGYIIIDIFLFFLHTLTSLTRFNRVQRFFGFCYIIIKVGLLVTVEIGLFPTLIGWWLDICSLELFDTTLLQRIESFFNSPGTNIFIHWLVGLFCVFYFVSFTFLVKAIVRPGLIWFVRNLNDPNFNPINEMINNSILSHIKRCVNSLLVFGTAIWLLIYMPICLIQFFMPKFLPYISSNDSPFTELFIELFLFQLVLPALIDHNEHNNSRKFIKLLILNWCKLMAYVLDLKGFLLGDNFDNTEHPIEDFDDESSQNYQKPNYFYFRVTLLLIAFLATLLLFGVFILTVPVLLGRVLINYWFGDIRVNEFNTAACGLYAIVIIIHAINVAIRGVARGWVQVTVKIQEWIPIAYKLVIASSLLLGVVPLLIGILFEVVILLPIRVPLEQTPVIYIYQDWAFGVLLTNVICAITMMTDLQFKEILEQVYNNGLTNINLRLILFQLAFPSISIFGLILALPYVIVNTLFPLIGASPELQTFINRRIHSILFIIALLFFLVKYQVNKFSRFYEHIRNDKYLVGRRLVNYEPNRIMINANK